MDIRTTLYFELKTPDAPENNWTPFVDDVGEIAGMIITVETQQTVDTCLAAETVDDLPIPIDTLVSEKALQALAILEHREGSRPEEAQDVYTGSFGFAMEQV